MNLLDSKQLNWGNILFAVGCHLILFVGLPLYLLQRMPSWGIVFVALVLFVSIGISTTAGYHRLFSHRAYAANPVMEGLFVFFGTLAFQGSVIQWSHNHRLHHSFTDTEKDPHNIKKGFWYAHMFWIFEKYAPIERKLVEDLYARRILVFQHKYCDVLSIGMNTALIVFFGWLFNDYLGSVLIIGALRVVLMHHFIGFINSIAHTWGSRVFSREHSAVNNAIIALFTFGEGYHNYHHVFPSDYRNGVRWYQYDPTKWFIWACHKIGWARDLKRVDKYTSLRTAIAEDGRVFLEAIRESILANKDEYEQKIVRLSESIKTQLNDLKEQRAKIAALKAERKEEEARERKIELRKRLVAFEESWSSWVALTKEMMSVPEISRLVAAHH